jgi:hypothetical protein
LAIARQAGPPTPGELVCLQESRSTESGAWAGSNTSCLWLATSGLFPCFPSALAQAELERLARTSIAKEKKNEGHCGFHLTNREEQCPTSGLSQAFV